MKPLSATRPLPLALLADGDADNRSMYAASLKSARWEVEEATDGRDALALALTRRPDVIVSDARLPGISGYDLCQLLRQDFSTRLVPIVLVAADDLARDLEHARTSGATSVLVKPCLPETLLREAARLFEQSKALRERSDAARERIPLQFAASERLIERAHATSRRMMSRTHQRGETDTPPVAPPELVCPECDRPLDYRSSQLGGVSAKNAEQWDYFTCAGGCGIFQYRQRTRKVRKV